MDADDITTPDLGPASEELLELFRTPFELDEWQEIELKLLAAIAQNTGGLEGGASGVPLVGQSFGEEDLAETITNRVVVDPEQLVTVINEEAINSSSPPDVSVSDASFTGDLGDGDEEVVALVESSHRNEVLEIRSVGVTAHKADIDSDNEDESVVRYHFEYQAFDSDQWTRLDGPSGVFPLGSLSRPTPLVGSSWVGPVSAFRIRFENYTDEAGLTATSVDEEDLGGRIDARIRPR